MKKTLLREVTPIETLDDSLDISIDYSSDDNYNYILFNLLTSDITRLKAIKMIDSKEPVYDIEDIDAFKKIARMESHKLYIARLLDQDNSKYQAIKLMKEYFAKLMIAIEIKNFKLRKKAISDLEPSIKEMPIDLLKAYILRIMPQNKEYDEFRGILLDSLDSDLAKSKAISYNNSEIDTTLAKSITDDKLKLDIIQKLSSVSDRLQVILSLNNKEIIYDMINLYVLNQDISSFDNREVFNLCKSLITLDDEMMIASYLSLFMEEYYDYVMKALKMIPDKDKMLRIYKEINKLRIKNSISLKKIK